MLSEAERIELRSLHRRGFGPDAGTLTAAERARLGQLTARHRDGVRASADGTSRGDGDRIEGEVREREGTGHKTDSVARGESPDRSGAADDMARLFDTDDEPEAAPPTVSTPRIRRPVLIIGAAVAAFALVAAGWAFGSRTSATALPDDFTAAVDALQRAEAWDSGSFRITAVLDGAVHAAGTIDGGEQACFTTAMMENPEPMDPMCMAGENGARMSIVGQMLSGPEQTSAQWLLSATVEDGKIGAATSDLTLMNTDGAIVASTDAETPVEISVVEQAPDVHPAVAGATAWRDDPVLVGGANGVQFWAGGADVDRSCVAVATDADFGSLELACASSTEGEIEIDVTDNARSLSPAFDALRAVVTVPADSLAPSGPAYVLRVTPED